MPLGSKLRLEVQTGCCRKVEVDNGALLNFACFDLNTIPYLGDIQVALLRPHQNP
jgi:hypothetical protein